MGFRIIGRKQKEQLADHEMREELVKREAERFGAFKGDRPQERAAEFIEKYKLLHTNPSSTDIEQTIAHLKKILKQNPSLPIEKLEPSIIKDLI